ncbi:MAG: PQQ-binding-like beta-propeller repeat protein, partial [Planctomycetes bacterium]|nr:PQQ-binding-like beta-propeller repeat protein [Planctomycetota bacterium]
MRRFRFLSLLLTSTLVLSSSTALAENNWPGWRGPLGTGHSNEKGLPVEWSQDDVVWKTELPGFGQSSPVVWKDRIFLTSALENGRQRIVFCVERASGKILWQQVAWNGSPEQTHRMNMFASATCATDGERVVAFFGRGGLHSYDLDGKHQWSCDLGQFAGPWGTAASPIIVGDLVIQNCDAEEESFIAGVNKKTGKEVWRTPLEKLRGWSTP